MSDLLQLIAAHQEAIVLEWVDALHDLPNSPYAALDHQALTLSVRRSCQALLRVMETGDMTLMESALQDTARLRAADGVRFRDMMAAWILYRQVVQRVLAGELHGPEAWEQLIDRVDSVMDWVMQVIYAVYAEAGLLEP
jgi:hypothetical protein